VPPQPSRRFVQQNTARKTIVRLFLLAIACLSTVAGAQSLDTTPNPLRDSFLLTLETSPNAIPSVRLGVTLPRAIMFSSRLLSPGIGPRLSIGASPVDTTASLDALLFWPLEPFILAVGPGVIYRGQWGLALNVGAVLPLGSGLGLTGEARWSTVGDVTAHLGLSWSFSLPTAGNP
jgi:hypothetical protein